MTEDRINTIACCAISILLLMNGIIIIFKATGYNTMYGTCGQREDWIPRYHLIDNETIRYTSNVPVYLNKTGVYRIKYFYKGRDRGDDTYEVCYGLFMLLGISLLFLAGGLVACLVQLWRERAQQRALEHTRTRQLEGHEFTEIVT